MKDRAQIRMLPDGRRLQMHDGPIDVIVEAFGEPSEIKLAYRAAATRFVSILDELCEELAFLRRHASPKNDLPSGVVARRMLAAVLPYAAHTFITPMAAVAGSVAEEILVAMTSTAELARAYVNNGGDIALHMALGQQFVVGMVECAYGDGPDHARPSRARLDHARLERASLFGTTTVHSSNPIRGVATSGRHGRSFSLGIADAVTVLADTAAMADAAATIVANAVDLPRHPAIRRVPACELAPDSDLGTLLVTQSVDQLTGYEVSAALDAGVEVAQGLRNSGLIRSAALNLQGETRVIDITTSSPTVRLSHSQRSLAHA